MSKIKDLIQAHGRVHFLLWDENGNLKLEREEDNLVVTSGLTFIASRMVANTAAVMSHMALGSGAIAAALGQTTLGGELGRAALTASSSAGAVATYSATFNPGIGTGAVSEAGIFNAAGANAGTMLNRVVFAVVNKAAGDTLAITWTVTLS